MAGSLLYDTTVEPRIELEGWDYITVNLNLPQNPALPQDYGGVSGGGIWRATFYMTEDEGTFLIENARRDIVLSGVAFYQTDSASRQIIGHGPRSLYAALYDHVSSGDHITTGFSRPRLAALAAAAEPGVGRIGVWI